MGHGVRTSLVTALIYATFEQLAPVVRDPGILLEKMNSVLRPMLTKEQECLFASACYMLFDATTGCLKIANAGHPYPVHIDSASNTVSWLGESTASRGPALAIIDNSIYSTINKQIQQRRN